MGARFSRPIHTSPEAHPASCTIGTGSLSLVGRRPGRWPPTPILTQRLSAGRATPLPSLVSAWHVTGQPLPLPFGPASQLQAGYYRVWPKNIQQSIQRFSCPITAIAGRLPEGGTWPSNLAVLLSVSSEDHRLHVMRTLIVLFLCWTRDGRIEGGGVCNLCYQFRRIVFGLDMCRIIGARSGYLLYSLSVRISSRIS